MLLKEAPHCLKHLHSCCKCSSWPQTSAQQRQHSRVAALALLIGETRLLPGIKQCQHSQKPGSGLQDQLNTAGFWQLQGRGSWAALKSASNISMQRLAGAQDRMCQAASAPQALAND